MAINVRESRMAFEQVENVGVIKMRIGGVEVFEDEAD